MPNETPPNRVAVQVTVEWDRDQRHGWTVESFENELTQWIQKKLYDRNPIIDVSFPEAVSA